MMRLTPLRMAPLLILVFDALGGHALTCHRTHYQKGDECCPRCGPGNRVNTDCTSYISTSCLPCNEGTFMDQDTGLKQCFPCATCDAGAGLKINRTCTRKSNATCEPLEGFFCVDPGKLGCEAAQRHKGCPPGQFISQNGTAFRDAVCSDCSVGTFSDGTFPSCRPHTQCESKNLHQLKPGTAQTDAECGEQSSGITAGVLTGVALVLVLYLVALSLKNLKKMKITLQRTIRGKKAVDLQEAGDLKGEERSRMKPE